MELYEQCKLESATLLKSWFNACKDQVQPDGRLCAVCGDIDHQAFECRFNPFVQFITSLEGLDLYFYFPKHPHGKEKNRC